MLEIKGIKKAYKDKVVLNGINLEVKKGEVFGLIGANGSGKTTLFNIIAQILSADGGEILLDGKKITCIDDLSHKLGYIIDIPAMFEYLTAKEYLEFLYSSSEKSKEEKNQRIEELLKSVGLLDSANKKIRTFSRGMKQKIGIVAGLIFEPEIILMDEPSSALDPIGRRDVLSIIENLKEQGKTIILSTHILNDIERVCTRVGLLVDGQIVMQGSISAIMKAFAENKLIVVADKEAKLELCKILEKKKLTNDFEPKFSALEIGFKNEKNKKDIMQAIIESEIPFNEISIKQKSLEEIFVLMSSKKGGKK